MVRGFSSGVSTTGMRDFVSTARGQPIANTGNEPRGAKSVVVHPFANMVSKGTHASHVEERVVVLTAGSRRNVVIAEADLFVPTASTVRVALNVTGVAYASTSDNVRRVWNASVGQFVNTRSVGRHASSVRGKLGADNNEGGV